MKIVLLSRYFPPEIGTAANLFYELAKALTDRGHEVKVLTGFPWYNLHAVPEKYRRKLLMKENMDGFEVKRLGLLLPIPHKLKLALGHISSPLTAFFLGLTEKKPDIIFAYSPPLPYGIVGWVLKTIKKSPFVMGVQDLHPQAYIDQGVLTNKALIRVLVTIEKLSYEKSSVVTVHSKGNKEHIVNKKGIDAHKVKVLPNWIDTKEVKPLPRNNKFSNEHKLDDKFIVGYAGTLGMSQGLMSVVEAARILRERQNIEFFIVGDGIEKSRMVQRAEELELPNIRFLPMQPKSVYPWVVASCDVGLVTLNAKVKTPVVPSKILSIMAAARPVLASMPLEGDAPKLIDEAECGINVPPEDPHELSKAIIDLSEDDERRTRYAENGREYVVREMSLKKVVTDLEELFHMS